MIWLLRTRKVRKEAASRGKTFDDIAAEHEEQGIHFKFAERKYSKKVEERENDVEMDANPDQSHTPQNSAMNDTREDRTDAPRRDAEAFEPNERKG